MPNILPPYPIDTPQYVPGMAISVQPLSAKHALWLDDYEYYDQLGRDPLQQRRIWGIADPKLRIARLTEVLDEFPKQMHRRKILMKAISRGDEHVVRCLCETGMRVCPDLEKARLQEQEEEEEEEGVDMREDGESENYSLPDKEDASMAPMHVAAVKNNVNILRIFVEHGVPIDVLDEFGRTPFLAAAMSYRPEAMRFLLGKGADATARAAGSELAKEYMHEMAACNALETIARRGDVEMMNMLLEMPGVEVTPLTIWSAAVGNDNYAALRMLLEREGVVPLGEDKFVEIEDPHMQELRQTLLDAVSVGVQENDVKSLKLLLALKYPGLQFDTLSPEQIPPELHKPFTYGAYAAMEHDQPDKFEFIYNLGIHEHATMSLDDVPPSQHLNLQHLLDDAAQNGSLGCVRLLINKYGADPNTFRTPPNITPLYFAAGNDKPDVVRYLLECQHVDIHMGCGMHTDGPTALWVAITHRSLESIELLLQHSGPFDEIDNEVLELNGPIDAVLIASRTGQVRFESETKAKAHIENARTNWQDQNWSYVRVKLDVGDQEWLGKLQIREQGNERRNREREKAKMIPECPVFLNRYDKLAEDDELIPEFQAAFVEVKK